MNTSSCSSSACFIESIAVSPPRSRFQRFVDFLLRHGGAVPVDATVMLPLDRVSGRTGIVAPREPERCCCY